MKQNFNPEKCITYTVAEVAEMLGCSRITVVRKTMKPGFIPFFKLGNGGSGVHVKFLREDVYRWISEQKEAAAVNYRHAGKRR
ncbi:MAG: helix-turn-helix domain-containing protein [Elusimicrobiota bacterium]|jgi:excisionase family DNA binding protein|nr:helix-turn-helix domain-containing protein [Elusimicrobiota bacterium]